MRVGLGDAASSGRFPRFTPIHVLPHIVRFDKSLIAMAFLNYHHLRYFRAIAHEGSLTKAARH